MFGAVNGLTGSEFPEIGPGLLAAQPRNAVALAGLFAFGRVDAEEPDAGRPYPKSVTIRNYCVASNVRGSCRQRDGHCHEYQTNPSGSIHCDVSQDSVTYSS